ncbi:hypothetical protein [Candidatus Xianfuyuplasma coldseepsis]|uniref:Uncharacterized protein n=1 Tax=Candidatus Xianfuyuplasma coldseepsis TaxID=2782163 RepID=A0A7L7KNN3_9MOLU|nr:hypothetical protein [Xianfuyuplasma coldseepsis]QMS84360.1 hypothetical protein G4Z02_00910 [Xianfuyuplasma coldseepsis]
MWLLYLAGFVFIVSIAAVMIAVVVMMKNSSKINAIEPVTIRAEVIGEQGQLPEGAQIYDPHHLGASRLSIIFHTDKDQYIKLNVKQKDLYRLIQGMYGDLRYHGNKLLSFTHLPQHEEARRQQRIADAPYLEGDVSSDVYFYVSMPSINMIIPTDQAIKANKDQIFTVIEQIYDNSTDNFCGLDNERQVIQFANDGYSTDIVMDIPDPKKEGSYQAVFYDIETVKDVIETFFKGEDIIAKYHPEFHKW